MELEFDEKYIEEAIILTEKSVKRGGFPCGAVIVQEQKIIGRGMSLVRKTNDATNHAEVTAIRDACKLLNNCHLASATLYSTVEPCLMCLHSSYWAGIDRIVFTCSKDAIGYKYFEGKSSLEECCSALHRQIKIVYVSRYEKRILNLVDKYESRPFKKNVLKKIFSKSLRNKIKNLLKRLLLFVKKFL